MNQEKIGKFIYDLRKKYNLTQAELANRLHVTAQAVSKWENGRGVPDIELLKRLSEEFDVSISELIEGKKERVQAFEGVVISRKGYGVSETFTVRKMSSGIGVERTFPVHSPKLDSITVVRKGKARRAKLYYARNIVGQFKTKERN